MTKVTILKHSDLYKGFEISGHAGYADAGSDIVCAAISALTINFINSIETFTDDGFIFDQDEKDGFMRFTFTEKASDNSQLLINSLTLGLKEISNEYKDYIILDFKEV